VKRWMKGGVVEPDRVIHRGRTLSLVRREVELPVGGRVTVELVRHPGAATILPLLNASRLLLIRQFRPAVGGWLWEIPAGTLDPGECAADCARRELLEETGYDAELIREVGRVYPVPDFSDDLVHVFVARNLRYRGQELQSDEVIEVVPIHLTRVVRMIMDGEITDAKTMISVLLLVGMKRCGQSGSLPLAVAGQRGPGGPPVGRRGNTRAARRRLRT
jgi:ADP-ribose pyrophosphatase